MGVLLKTPNSPEHANLGNDYPAISDASWGSCVRSMGIARDQWK